MNKTTAYIIAFFACLVYFFVHSVIIAEMGGIRPFWRMLTLLPIFWIWRGIVGIAKTDNDKSESQNIVETIEEEFQQQPIDIETTLEQSIISNDLPLVSPLPVESIEKKEQSPNLPTPFCPKCNKKFAVESKFCDIDGVPLCLPNPKCATCGKEYPIGTKYCSEDGLKLAFGAETKSKSKKMRYILVAIIAIVLLLLAVLGVVFIFDEIRWHTQNTQSGDTPQYGVVINGVRWATRNVGTFGTLAAQVEDFGGRFTWEQAQRACPNGWRIPHADDIYALINTNSYWIVRNGVNGRLFGTAPYQIFLPAAGWRDTERAFHDVGELGVYWSGYCDKVRHFLLFNENNMRTDYDRHSFGFSIRCVADY